MRSSSSESDRTYDSSCSENSSDRRRLSSSAARRRSCSERCNRCRRRHSTPPAPSMIRARAANSSGCCRTSSMRIYIHQSHLRINLLLCLSLASCRAEPRPAVSRVWPELGAMLSAAAWSPDTARVARILAAARAAVDRLDSLLQRRVRIAALDSAARDMRRRTGVTIAADSFAAGYALDRAVLVLAADGLTAAAWSAAFVALSCDSVLVLGTAMNVVCADSAGVRWTTSLQNRVSRPAARAP